MGISWRCSCGNSIALSCRREERDALLEFKQSLQWNSSDGFPLYWEGEDCCDWEGLSCDRATGHVISLEIVPLGILEKDFYTSKEWETPQRSYPVVNASGLSPSLQRLRYLNHLDLSGLRILGSTPIPAFIGSMKHLSYLNLSNIGFHGAVPPHLGNLTSLEVLDLRTSDYYLSRDALFLAHSHWISRLVALKHLDLSGVSTRKAQDLMQVLNSLPSVSNLTLRSCFSPGAFSTSPGLFNSSFLAILQHLDLSWNSLQGPIPPFLQNMTAIRHLDLSHNNLSCSIPSIVENLEARNLFLNDNLLTGPIPASLCKLRSVLSLDLSRSKLSSWIPNCWGNATFNSIPGKRRNFSSTMALLDLSHNQISGSIPASIFENLNVEVLFLNDNLLTGPIPASLCKLRSVLSLDLSRNKLSGWIPNCWEDATFNFIPRKPRNFSSIMDLDLSHNQISGSIPASLGENLEMNYLFLNDNLLTGPIPASLCKSKSVSLLDLSRNRLSGWIPDCLGNATSLSLINFSSNKLSGVIPSSIGNLLLWSLHLNNNSLHGEIPDSFRDLSALQILDLGENELSGALPAWFGAEFQVLEFLRLRENHFTGTLPMQLCSLPKLQLLDLAVNNLHGTIPRCFGNLSSMSQRPSLPELDDYGIPMDWQEPNAEPMTVVTKGRELEYTTTLKFMFSLDLSSNNFSGLIPHELTSLAALQSLNLSHNLLSGNIPEKIGDMKWLESLDFSGNRLSGEILPSISLLTMLSHLNLSNNNIAGKIPKSSQLDSLYADDHSIYSGNPLLCGDPLLNKCSDQEEAPKPPKIPSRENMGGLDPLDKVTFYGVVMLEFATGFWGAIGILVFKKSWSTAYFTFAEEIANKIYVAVSLKVAKLKARMRGE